MKRIFPYGGGKMAHSQSILARLLAGLLLAAGVAFLGCVLKERFADDSYDLLHSFANQGTFNDSRVIIVYLDLASFIHEHQDPGERWPRRLHAQLLRRLTADGARAVVFDVLFDGPSEDASADKDLAAAIKQNGRTILSAEHENKITHETSPDINWTRATQLTPPYKLFADTAASWGVPLFWSDDDFTVRRHLPAFQDGTLSISRAAAKFIGATNDSDRELWVRYYGPAITIPHVSYSEALDLAGLQPGFFKDKVVFIGARPIEGFMDARRDEFRSPFHSWSYKEYLMPGVEVHATELLNLMRGDALRRLSSSEENVILFAVALLFGGGLIWLRPATATVAAAAGAGIALEISRIGFAHSVWFPWMVVSGAQIPAALCGSWLWQFQEWFFTRRKMEAAKLVADAKIREQAALIEKAHDAILVQDLHGKILYANSSAEKLYGWKLSEFTSDAAVEMFSPDAAATHKARALALKDGEWNGELRQQTKSGKIVIVASRWTLIREDSGQPGALLLINSDITENKSLEQQFLRTQRMNTIGTLAGGMAHDINNALAPVLLGTQLLRRKSGDEEDKKLLSLIETSTNRSAEMVRQVLLFARGKGGELERVELGPLVKELERIVRETFPKNIAMETFVPRDLWPVDGNLTQIHQVLLNLCVNARDAMPNGGKLSVALDNVELSGDDAAKITDGRAGEFVSLLVADTGTGITDEVKAKILEPFFTTKGEGKGTGIGLSTVARILKTHSGFLRIESEVGEGSSFEAFLPRAASEAAMGKPATNGVLPRGNGELILVADDEQALCELVAAELKDHGYRVLTASNGVEAVAQFRQYADEVKLFIASSAMPVMDGNQALVEIQKLRPNLPAIITTGDAGGPDQNGVTQLAKPFTLADLLHAVSCRLK